MGSGTAIVLSDEERRRRSERITRLNAEGRAGAAFGRLGGRPRKPRASELIAAEVRENAKELHDILMEAARGSKAPRDRITAAKTLVDIEVQETKIEEKELDRLEHLGRDELGRRIAESLEALTGIATAGATPRIIDARVDGDDDGSGVGRLPAIDHERRELSRIAGT